MADDIVIVGEPDDIADAVVEPEPEVEPVVDAPDIVVAPVIVTGDNDDDNEDDEDEADEVSLVAIALAVGELAGSVKALSDRVDALTAEQIIEESETVPVDTIVVDEDGNPVSLDEISLDETDRIAPASSKPHWLFRSMSDFRNR